MSMNVNSINALTQADAAAAATGANNTSSQVQNAAATSTSASTAKMSQEEIETALESFDIKDASKYSQEVNEAKLQDLTEEKEKLQEQAKLIETKIENLSEEIKESVEKIVKEQKQLSEEQKQEAKEIINKQVENFKEKREKGENVTLSDLNGWISSGISKAGFDTEMANLMGELVATDAKTIQMDSMLDSLGSVGKQIAEVDKDICTLNDVIKSQKEAAAAAQAAANQNTRCCDPIGFEKDGKKIEFVVDNDNNDKLSNFGEFLGAEDQFKAMEALDKDGDKKVTAEELEAGNVKLCIDGANNLEDLSDTLGDDFSVDLNSYTKAADDAVHTNGQELLGNFNVNVGGETIQAYSTLDSADYLLNNYKFSDENPNNLAGLTGTTASDEDIAAFVEKFTATNNEYKEQIQGIYKEIGLSEDEVKNVAEMTKNAGEAEAKAFMKEMEAKEKKEAEEAKEEKETTEAEEPKEEAGEPEEEPVETEEPKEEATEAPTEAETEKDEEEKDEEEK